MRKRRAERSALSAAISGRPEPNVMACLSGEAAWIESIRQKNVPPAAKVRAADGNYDEPRRRDGGWRFRAMAKVA